MDKIEMRIIQEDFVQRRLVFQWLEEGGMPRMVAIDFDATTQHIFPPFFADLLENVAQFIRNDWYNKQKGPPIGASNHEDSPRAAVPAVPTMKTFQVNDLFEETVEDPDGQEGAVTVSAGTGMSCIGETVLICITERRETVFIPLSLASEVHKVIGLAIDVAKECGT